MPVAVGFLRSCKRVEGSAICDAAAAAEEAIAARGRLLPFLYRVTHQVGLNLLLISKEKLGFSKRNIY